jgi:hypothetical protein
VKPLDVAARGDGFWRAVGIPVLLSLGIFTAANALWNYPPTDRYLGAVPYPVAVYLLAGSGLALVLLWRALRAGRLSREELGLALSGWTPRKRVAGLLLLFILSFGEFADHLANWTYRNGQPPTWGDYCFWYIFFLMSSLAETLAFIGVAFCLPEAWLRRRGWGRLAAAALPAGFASVAFGLFHYSHKPEYHALVFPLMPEWFLLLVFFAWSRNFTLTLVLHNAYVAMGFTAQQNSVNLADFQNPPTVVAVLCVFAVPFGLLHCLEGWRRADARHRGE